MYIRDGGSGNPPIGRLDMVSNSGGSFFDARFLSDALGSVTQVCERERVCARERERERERECV